MKNQQAAQPQ